MKQSSVNFQKGLINEKMTRGIVNHQQLDEICHFRAFLILFHDKLAENSYTLASLRGDIWLLAESAP